MQLPTHKHLILFTGTAYPELASEVAVSLGMRLGNVEISTFADSQTYVRFSESVRGSDAFIIQSMCDPVDHHFMQHLLMIDAAKRASAKRITAVCPLYPYSRQDRKARGREPISAKLAADFYEAAGTDRIIAVDLHAGQIQGFFDGPFDHLTATPMLADYFAEHVAEDDVVIISPDAGGVRLADKWSEHLSEFHGISSQVGFLHKKRHKDRRNVTETLSVVGDVRGKVCIAVDDIIDTGGSLVSGAEALYAAGATDVYGAATHAVMSDPAVDRIKNSQVRQLIVTNTLPIGPEKEMDKLVVLSIAPTLASTIKAVFEEESVSELFHGENQP